MISLLIRLIGLVALSLVSVSANATTYNVDENFTGTYSVIDLGSSHFSLTHNETFAFLTSGDSSLFSSSFTSTIPNANGAEVSGVTWCDNGCYYTETLNTGDKLLGQFILNGV